MYVYVYVRKYIRCIYYACMYVYTYYVRIYMYACMYVCILRAFMACEKGKTYLHMTNTSMEILTVINKWSPVGLNVMAFLFERES
jgi:hypothetical protein